ncbi:MAG: DNA primase [Flavobacteriales bacterium]|nr:MAG: DNA primase [Flavobacteriales bacterium]
MRAISIIIIVLFSATVFAQKKDKVQDEPVISQEEKELIRNGNDFYNEQNFVEAEVQYKKALENNPGYEKANYNLGNAIYQQNRYKDALPKYELASKIAKEGVNKAESFHNMGNSYMKQKQYAQAIDAYKNALRNNPNDDETRYNLALAKKLLKNEQSQKQDDNKDDKNKDKKQNDKTEDNKDNKDKKDKKDEKDNKDKDKNDKDNDNKDNKNQNKDKNNEDNKDKQQPQPQPNKLSPQQVKQLLEAMSNEENKTQQKVNKKKVKGQKIKREKDW